MAEFDYSSMPAIVTLSPSKAEASSAAQAPATQSNTLLMPQGGATAEAFAALQQAEAAATLGIMTTESPPVQQPPPLQQPQPQLPPPVNPQQQQQQPPQPPAIPLPLEFAGAPAGNSIQQEINEWLSTASDNALGMFETCKEAKQAVAQGSKYLAIMSRNGGYIDDYLRLPSFESANKEMINIYVAELCLTNPQLGYDPQSGAAKAAWNQTHPRTS